MTAEEYERRRWAHAAKVAEKRLFEPAVVPPPPPQPPRQHKGRPVINCDTGERYAHAWEAAEKLGVTESNVRMALCKGYRCNGYLLRFVGQAPPAAGPPKRRRIRCVQTGEITYVGAVVGNKTEWMRLYRAIKAGRRFKGKTWERLDPPRNMPWLRKGAA